MGFFSKLRNKIFGDGGKKKAREAREKYEREKAANRKARNDEAKLKLEAGRKGRNSVLSGADDEFGSGTILGKRRKKR